MRSKYRISHILICNECGEKSNLEDIDPKNDGWGSSGFISVFCPHCFPRRSNFSIFFEYQKIYRIRCTKCGKMFDAKNTYEIRCPTCDEEHLRALSKFGGGF